MKAIAHVIVVLMVLIVFACIILQAIKKYQNILEYQAQKINNIINKGG